MLSLLPFLVFAGQATWQLEPNGGQAIAANGGVTVSAGGVAKMALPSLKSSWRISFSVKEDTGSGQTTQFVAVAGSLTLLRLSLSKGSPSTASLAQDEGLVDVNNGDGWHSVELYDIHGYTSMRWDDRLATQGFNDSDPPTTLQVGVPQSVGSSTLGLVQVKDVEVESLDNSLRSVPGDVPVRPDPGFEDSPLQQHLAGQSASGIAILKNGVPVVSGKEVTLNAPPLTTITLDPGTAPEGFSAYEAGLVARAQMVDHKLIVRADKPLPPFSYSLSSTDLATYSISYVVADDSKRQVTLQRLRVIANEGLPSALQISKEPLGYVVSTQLPITHLSFYDSGLQLGSVDVQSGKALIPLDDIPSGESAWDALGSNDKGEFWGPFQIKLAVEPRVKINAQPLSLPTTWGLNISATPSPAAGATRIRILVDDHIVEEGPVGPVARTVVLLPGEKTATVAVELVAPDGTAFPRESVTVTPAEAIRTGQPGGTTGDRSNEDAALGARVSARARNATADLVRSNLLKGTVLSQTFRSANVGNGETYSEETVLDVAVQLDNQTDQSVGLELVPGLSIEFLDGARLDAQILVEHASSSSAFGQAVTNYRPPVLGESALPGRSTAIVHYFAVVQTASFSGEPVKPAKFYFNCSGTMIELRTKLDITIK